MMAKGLVRLAKTVQRKRCHLRLERGYALLEVFVLRTTAAQFKFECLDVRLFALTTALCRKPVFKKPLSEFLIHLVQIVGTALR